MQVSASLETIAPDLRTDLRTTLEMAERPVDDPLTDDLRQRRASRVATVLNNRAEELIPRLALPREPWRLRWFGVPLVVGAFVALVAPSLWLAGWQQFLHAPLQHEHQEFLDEQLVERLFFAAPDIWFEPPAYLGHPAGFLPSIRNLAVPHGTRMEFQWHALEPIREAEVILGDGPNAERVPLVQHGSRTWVTSLRVMEALTLRLEVTTERGLRGRDVAQRRVVPIADEPPVVVLQDPTGTLTVTPEDQVGLSLLVTDDNEISEISVRWALRHEEEPRWQHRTVASELRTQTWEGTWVLDLRPLQLQPRDEVLVVVDAVDYDDVSGPNVGSSEVLLLRVVAEDEPNREVLRLKEVLFDALLDRLGDHLPLGLVTYALDVEREAVIAVPARVDAAIATERLEAAAELAPRWQEAVETAAALVDALEGDPLSSERETTLWSGTAGQLIALTETYLEGLTAVMSQVGTSAVEPADFRRIAEAHDAQMRAVERTVLLLGDLIAEQRADILERSMEELREARERLRELLEEYRDTQDPELRAAIAAEISRLQRRMQELIQQMREQTEQMPWEHVNVDAMDPSEMAEQVGNMSEAFEEMRQRLEDGDVDAALEMLDRFGESLEQLLDGAGEFASGMGLDSVSRFDEAVGELMEEITHLSELQRSIEDQTQALEESQREAREESMRERATELTESQTERMGRVQQRLGAAAPGAMGETLQRRFDEAQRGFERLQQDLEEGDVASALQRARLQSSLTNDLKQASIQELLRRESVAEAAARAADRADSQDAAEVRDAAAARAAAAADARAEAYALWREAERASQEMDAVVQELASLMEQGRPQMSPQAEAVAEQLRQDQGQALERVEQLRRRLEEVTQDVPGIAQSLEPELREVQRAMSQAEEGLGERRMRDALQSEREVIQRLDQARESLQESMQRERRRQREQGRQHRQDRVEIPQDGVSDRASFRQRVLEAMQDETIDGYREGIRSYYEGLVRD